MKGPDRAMRDHDIRTQAPPLQSGSSLKLPAGQFLYGRSPQDERARPDLRVGARRPPHNDHTAASLKLFVIPGLN